jgi:hypothetical protein
VVGQTNTIQNGLYTVTNVGSVSSNWVLTRATDYDGSVSGVISPGDFLFIYRGAKFTRTLWT